MKLRESVKNRLVKSARVTVLTGAGVSAESGIPTFRGGGEGVVWKRMPFDQISSAHMVEKDLDAVWEWFDYRRGLYSKCEPNAAHFALAEWQDTFEEFALITQNVDGLHERAGSKSILELHGNINHARCTRCRKVYKMNVEDIPHKPTHCDDCGEKVRPDVVLFGEMLPEGVFDKAVEKASNCDVFLIIGTSALVYPAAMLPETARQNGAYLIEINPEETPLTQFCDESIRGNAGDAVPSLLT